MSYKRKASSKFKPKTNSYTFTSQNKKWNKKQYKSPYKKNKFLFQPTKPNSWLDGTFAVDPLTWEEEFIKTPLELNKFLVKHYPKA
jgi:hypothetical protein